MKLRNIADIQSGYLSRKKIEPDKHASYFILQSRDVNADYLSYSTENLVRFSPELSKKDWILKPNDLLFLARGAKNFSVLLRVIPDAVLAAGCFFIVRVTSEDVLPEYLWWYLNQAPVENYFMRHTGRGVHMPVVTRAVLENLEVSVPSMEIQKNIVSLDELMRREHELLSVLATKRKLLASAVCLGAVKNFEGKRKK